MLNFTTATQTTGPQHDAIGAVDDTWTQGRTAFGGLGAGIAVTALTPLIPEGRRIRSIAVQFTGPVAPGPVQVRSEVLRSGRSVTQARADVLQNGEIAVSVLATIAESRRTSIRVPAPAPKAIASPEDCLHMPYIPGVTPVFTQHFDYRWASKNLPFSGGSEPTIEGWVRFHAPTRPTPAAILGLVDSWPAPILTLVTQPIAASSVTWLINFHDAPDDDPTAFFRFSSTNPVSEHGYADMDGYLWDQRGRLIATSRQLVAEFSPA